MSKSRHENSKSAKSASSSRQSRPKSTTSTLFTALTEGDPFLCHCGPCRTFHKRHFGSQSQLSLSSKPLTLSTQNSTRWKPKKLLKKGDRVIVWGKYKGFVKYVGFLRNDVLSPVVYVGVHLDDNIGSLHNGIHNGKRYFYCPRGHGAMVRYNEVTPCVAPEKRPPLTGNYMYPSYKVIQEHRRIRREQDPEFDIGSRSSGSSQEYGAYHGRKTPYNQHVFDKEDVGYKDYIKRENQEPGQVEKKEPRKSASRDRRLEKWKEEFGGDERADKMVQTLKKLHHALDEGRALQNGNKDVDADSGHESSEDDED